MLERALKRSERPKWFLNMDKGELLSTKVKDGEVDNLLLVRSNRNSVTFNPMQLSASVLSNSKATLAKGFYHLFELFGHDVRVLYTDTDCYHLACSGASLLEAENPALSPEEKERLRLKLFGFSDAKRAYSACPETAEPEDPSARRRPLLTGTLKIEGTFTVGWYPALKAYLLVDRDSDCRVLKFKSVVQREALSDEDMRLLAQGRGMLLETRQNFKAGMGVVLDRKTVLLGGHRSHTQWKFRVVGDDVQAFG